MRKADGFANVILNKRFPFERHRKNVADQVDHVRCAKSVLNLAIGLKDSRGQVATILR